MFLIDECEGISEGSADDEGGGREDEAAEIDAGATRELAITTGARDVRRNIALLVAQKNVTSGREANPSRAPLWGLFGRLASNMGTIREKEIYTGC